MVRLRYVLVWCLVLPAVLIAASLQTPARPATQKPPAPAAQPVVTPLSTDPLDRIAAKWVDDTFLKMTLDDKVGQLVVAGIQSSYLADDSDEVDRWQREIAALKIGGVHVFGASEPSPDVLLDERAASVTLGQPLAAAWRLNRLQTMSAIPLLNTTDFETGAGFRLAGATTFPRQMAVAAAGDEQLAFDAARIAAIEGRALGIHVNFSPVADVNNNPRNPVINTRSFGGTPALVGRFVAAYVRGLHAGGMLATLKHFPGHGDTDTDSHIGLPIIARPRDQLDAVELAPFRAGLSAGADAVMTGHIVLPALDSADFAPASLSQPIVTGLLRRDMKFDGLVYTDSMDMAAIAGKLAAGEAAARAIRAGNDVVVNPPDLAAAVAGIKAAVGQGTIPMAQVDASVRRILRTKARLGLYKTRTVPLDDVPKSVGGRQHAMVAEAIGRGSITLIKDDRNQVPLRAPRDASVLYLSVLDYPTGWGIGAPGRTFVPELRRRWPNVTAIELSDRTTPSEIDLVRSTALRFDAIVAAVFVRTASASGRMDLPPAVARLLDDLGRRTVNSPKPFVTVFFGNPYATLSVTSLPAMLLTYDFYDLAEQSAIRALAGEAPISGHLPVPLPGLAEAGYGIVR